jgi:hypothetical protein
MHCAYYYIWYIQRCILDLEPYLSMETPHFGRGANDARSIKTHKSKAFWFRGNIFQDFSEEGNKQ